MPDQSNAMLDNTTALPEIKYWYDRPNYCKEYTNAKSLVITDLKYCRKEKYNPNTMIAQFCKHLLANVTSPMPSA